ncbi:DUF5988 family protein [Streptomyces sp. NPDC020965]|uniref:DUF5988 family protein n=1 Tax=Streptomyces sp. NPDC020965 TaxID=3365105 RepID=UPI0037B68D5F
MDETPNIVLEGGSPNFVPQQMRVCYTPDENAKFKLLLGNRYEHFQPVDERVVIDGRKLRVFRWSYRTYVAE